MVYGRLGCHRGFGTTRAISFSKAPRGVPAAGEVLDPAGDGRGVAAPAEGELLPRPRPRPRPRLHPALHRHARAQGHGVHHLLAAAARRRVCRRDK